MRASARFFRLNDKYWNNLDTQLPRLGGLFLRCSHVPEPAPALMVFIKSTWFILRARQAGQRPVTPLWQVRSVQLKSHDTNMTRLGLRRAAEIFQGCRYIARNPGALGFPASTGSGRFGCPGRGLKNNSLSSSENGQEIISLSSGPSGQVFFDKS